MYLNDEETIAKANLRILKNQREAIQKAKKNKTENVRPLKTYFGSLFDTMMDGLVESHNIITKETTKETIKFFKDEVFD